MKHRQPLSVTLLTFSVDFFSEAVEPLLTRFIFETPWVREMKVCSNGFSLLTKMAVIPIYGKTCEDILQRSEMTQDLHCLFKILILG